MSKAVDYNPEESLEELFLKSIKVKRKLYDASMDRKNIVWRKRNYEVLTEQSELSAISLLWNNLTTTKKARWESAGVVCGLTGYQLFVQDTSYRLENNLPGLIYPSLYHQYKIARVIFDNNDDYGLLRQYHPNYYYLWVDNVGQKNARTPVRIDEDATSPITISFYYYAEVEEYPGASVFGVQVQGWASKDDVDFPFDETVNLEQKTGWCFFTYDFVIDCDFVYSYVVDLRFDYVKGVLKFDNFSVEHDGENYAIDPNCDNINEVLQYTNLNNLENWTLIMTYQDIVKESIYP